ncbi:N-acetylneuraminate synthase family protein [Caulobacter sp. NIBR2454]|uniref:N-acetylneuraminate synthase family protein n=1 Tax=Caulobacter sp. NIBR2454 TaxID=3015996 RepID=UPI0022B705FD|nr:N-acetylneuraminate synthase family protein [Caulobacter sp. NIBR2454]
MARIKFGDRHIGEGEPCYLVAEIGANHDGDPDKCLELVRLAAAAGADAVKLQTYTAAELVADPERVITWGPEGLERSETIGGLFDRLALPRDAHAAIFAEAKRLGVTIFSTPFSLDGIGFLSGLGAPGWKIASSDIQYGRMLDALAATGQPVIMSTGKHTLAEVDAAVSRLRRGGCKELVLLHCIAQYPAPMDEMNLRSIPALQGIYPDAPVGLSDHSIGVTAGLGAVALGARMIEKHFTYDKAADGPDHWFSADPAEFAALVRGVREMEAALGGVRLGVTESEIVERRNAVRSLVTARPIKAGQAITDADLTALRPGWGINPMQAEAVVGLAPGRDLPAGQVLTWDDLKPAP